MRLTLLKNGGRWRMGEMQKLHLDFLKLAADDASMSDCPGARERLFPKPLSGKEEWIDDEFNEEWKELMAPELEMQFAGEVGTFLADLDAAQPEKGKIGAGTALFRLEVPLAHGQAWFSTLNQARLLLDLKYKLHDPRDAPGEPAAQKT
ncbi:MAG TPA: hypothetical protein VGH65_01515, partial [Verrucomicrobiaceae bacterium]